MARDDIDILQAPVKRFVTCDWADGGDTVTGAKWNHATASNASFSIGALSTRAMTMTTTAAENAGVQFQSAPFFRLAAGIKWYCKVSLTPSAATESDFWAGFAIIDTDITSTLPIDAFLWMKDDGNTEIDVKVCQASATPVTGLDNQLAAVADTEYVFEVEVTGLSATSAVVKFYLNGTLYETVTSTGHTSGARFAFSMGYFSGSAAINTCTFAKVYAYQDESFV